ncbi:AraC family transcriptional regulator [Desulfovibrio aminophilus]|nr:AraC family transcriptional regulator [Desulfovibrio aminophilus]MCM0754862.1 AraC family transcriptional regulator [Desulfovibrio aminophilus]
MAGKQPVFIRAEQAPGLALVRGVGLSGSLPRHVHASWCFGTVEQGRRVLGLGGVEHEAVGGDVLVLVPGQVHSLRQDGPCAFAMFSLEPGAARAALGAVLAPGSAAPRFRSPVLRDPALFEGLLRLAAAVRSHASSLEVQALLLESLARLVSHGDTTPAPARACSEAVTRARRLLEERFSENIGLPELAGECGADPWSLCRAFSAEVGLPPHAFQSHLRVARAKELLAHGATPAEAALASGFFDQSHLHRHFVRLVGLTPGRFAAAFR